MTTSLARLGQRIAAGAGWLILLRIVERVIGVFSTLILVRVLIPDDFGVVAMAMSMVALVEALGSFGLDMALIRKQEVSRDYYDTVWTIGLIYGVVAGLTLCASSVLVAQFYAEPRLTMVVLFLGFVAIIGGFENVGIIDFQKNMQFDREFMFRLTKKLTGFAVTVTLAFALQNYWALLWGSASARVVGVGLSYLIHPFRPKLTLTRSNEIWRFSFWMWLSNTTVFAAVRGYDFIIGKVSGARSLGLYSVSYEVATLPTTELVDPISRALLPGFASIAGDAQSLKQSVLASAGLIAALTLPLGFGLMILAEPLVLLILGAKWMEAVPLVSALAAYGVMRAAHAGTGSAYVVLGYPRSITWVNLPHIVVGWPLMLLLLPRFGIGAAAYCLIAASACGLSINFLIARRLLGIRGLEVLTYYWRPALACIAMVLSIYTFLPAMSTGPTNHVGAIGLGGIIIVGAISYIAVLFLIWHVSGRRSGAERVILDWIQQRFARN